MTQSINDTSSTQWGYFFKTLEFQNKSSNTSDDTNEPNSILNNKISTFVRNAVEDYFYITGDKAKITTVRSDNLPISASTKIHYEGKLEYNQQSSLKKIWNIFKVASYFTVIAPIFMLGCKWFLRSNISLEIENKQLFSEFISDELSVDENIQLSSEFISDEPSVDENKTVVFGDIHGELNGFYKNLLRAKVISKKILWGYKFNTNFHGTIIQMGDVIDRGPNSVGAWNFLQKIQNQANKDQVIRLLGNHELYLLQGEYGATNFTNPQELKGQIKQDILNGKVKLAHWDGQAVYSHAGITPSILKLTEKEIRTKENLAQSEEIHPQKIVDHLNSHLKTLAALEPNEIKALQDEDLIINHPQLDRSKRTPDETAALKSNLFNSPNYVSAVNKIDSEYQFWLKVVDYCKKNKIAYDKLIPTELLDSLKDNNENVRIPELLSDLEEIDSNLEEIRKKALSKGNPAAILRIGIERGGQWPQGGPLWADISEMNGEHFPFLQVIAHTTPWGDTVNKKTPIRVNKLKNYICVDAGLCKGYGGNNAFIRFKKGNVKIYNLNKNKQEWEKKKL